MCYHKKFQLNWLTDIEVTLASASGSDTDTHTYLQRFPLTDEAPAELGPRENTRRLLKEID